MHIVSLLGVLMATACAGPFAAPSDPMGELAISLARASVEARPVVVVTMTNRSQAEVCIRAELLRNPYSYAMDLRLRNSRGEEVKREPPGFLPPPIMEPVSIAPGASVQGQYYLDARFKLKGGGKQVPREMSARAAFRYDACDGSHSRQAVSAWQRI